MAEYVMEYDGWAEGIPIGEYLKVRDAMHVRKREEVVRCRECGWFEPDGSDHEHRSGCWCKWWGTDLARPDKFCAWGKRRADG